MMLAVFVIAERRVIASAADCVCTTDGTISTNNCGSCSHPQCVEIGSTACDCITNDPDASSAYCLNESCVTDQTPGDAGVGWSLGGNIAATSCCGDDSDEYYIDSTGGGTVTSGGTACCNSASDCATSDSSCVANGWYDNTPDDGLLCDNSNFLSCTADYCGDSVSIGSDIYRCATHDWAKVTCDGDSCACGSAACGNGNFISCYYTGPNTDCSVTHCCTGTVKYVADVEVGGQGTNDCGTLDGVSYDDCIVEGHTAVS